MTPEDILGLRQDMYTFRTGMDELTGAIQEHSKTVRVANEERHDALSARPIQAIITYGDGARADQIVRYRAQSSISRAVWAAFAAAAIYAGIAAFTYFQIQRGTRAATDSAAAAQLAAKTAQQALAASNQISSNALAQMQAQNDAMQNVADTAHKQLLDYENSQRAILVAQQTISEDGRQIVFRLTNVGATPAIEIRVDAASAENSLTVTSSSDINGYPPEAALESRIRPISPDKGGFILKAGDSREFVANLPQEKDIPHPGYAFTFLNVGYRDVFGRTGNTYSCAWAQAARHDRFQQCNPLASYGGAKDSAPGPPQAN